MKSAIKIIVLGIILFLGYYFLTIYYVPSGDFKVVEYVNSSSVIESEEKGIFIQNANKIEVKDSLFYGDCISIWFDKDIRITSYGLFTLFPCENELEMNKKLMIDYNHKSCNSILSKNKLLVSINHGNLKVIDGFAGAVFSKKDTISVDIFTWPDSLLRSSFEVY